MNRPVRLLGTVLVACMLLAAGRFMIFSSYLKTQKANFRVQVLADPKASVIILTIPDSSLYRDTGKIEWKDDNKELVMDGIYHEVVRVEKSGTNIVVYLVEDREESRLYAEFLDNCPDHSGSSALVYYLVSFQCIAANYSDLKSGTVIEQPYIRQSNAFTLKGYPSARLKPPSHRG